MKDALEKAIGRTAYVLDCLRVLKEIMDAGSCNECEFSTDCRYAPKPGQLVRYNCPHFEWGERDR